MAARNRIQRYEFGTWKPMNRVLALGVDEQAPRLVVNAAYDQQGAIMPMGQHDTVPVAHGAGAAYPADMDGLGTIAFLDDLDLSTTPNAWLLYTDSAGAIAVTGTQALFGVNAAAGTQYASPGLFEGVGYGHCPRDSGPPNPDGTGTEVNSGQAYVVLTTDGQVYRTGTHGIATITGFTTPAESTTLNGVEHSILIMSCVITSNGLFVVGAYQKVVTPTAGDSIVVNPAWPFISTVPYVLLYYIRESTATDYRLVQSVQNVSSFKISALPGVANDPLPDGSVAYAMNFYGEGDDTPGSLPATLHQRRFYAVSGRMQTFHSYSGSAVELAARYGTNITALNARVRAGRTVCFSEIGYVNFASAANWFDVPFAGQDEKITGMLSTPAGLLIFGRNEMFLSRGDPLDSNWTLQRVSGTLGSDGGDLLLRPVRAGGTAFFVSKGRIMSKAFGMGDVDFGGQTENLSAPVTDQSFVDDAYAVEAIAVVPSMKMLAYLTPLVSSVHTTMLYSFEAKAWAKDAVGFPGSVLIRPNHISTTVPFEYIAYGSGGVYSYDYNWPPDLATTSYQIIMEFGDIALGDRDLWKLWTALELFTNDGVSAISVTFTPSDGSGSSFAMTNVGQNVWRGFFPMGLVSRRLSSLKLTFTTTGAGRVYPKMGLFAAARQRFH